MTMFQKGYIPWNKGLKGYTNSGSFKKGNKLNLGKHFSFNTEFKKGHKHLEKIKQKISKSHLGKTTWMKGKYHSKKSKYKMRLARLGKPHLGTKGWKQSEESKKKIREHWNPDCLRRHPKSSLEIKFENIINNLNLPYKFVGNGDFLIGRKCPDFINTNGEKIAVEVYYKKHKEMFGQAKNKGIDWWKQERQEIFSQYGWKIEYFDETQVNLEEIKRRFG